uniref:Transporter n=1 Tax=Sinocyclocheilus anshuiensis TaxID=1608454 RepID=A0A671RSJ2_9TELE
MWLLQPVMCSRVLRVRGQAEDSSLQDRGQWASKAEFLLAVAAQIIGLGNVWRFPYLCYKNGGGVFFVPYMLFLVVCGVPLFLLETALGQFTSLGGVGAWMKICPLFAGLGFASQMMILHSCVYYIVILAWAFFYLCSSFQTQLPWSHCNNTWNTDSCRGFDRHNMSDLSENATSPVIEFWEREVLDLSASVDRLDSVNWRLALCLLLVWTVCYFCVWKGVKSIGKVVYVTATFPYLMLLVLLVRGVSLPGAVDGIVYYLKPNHTRLMDPQVWMDAGTQIFFSYGICLGSLTALGSYNKFNNDCYKDCFRLCLLNSSTSVIAGFAIFSVLGFMAQEKGVDIADVVQSGPGLAFIAYPRAVSMMPLPQLWAVCIFLMILMLGLDTQFVSLEALIMSVSDLYPTLIRRCHGREILLLLVCLVCFLIGLLMVTPGGLYVFQIYDNFSCSGASLLLLSVCQSVAIGWIYSADRFSNNIKAMIGYQPLCIFRLSSSENISVCVQGTFGFSLMFWSPLTLANGVTAPVWATVMGWTLTLSSVSLLPLWAIYSLMNTPGTLQQFELKITHTHAHICICMYVYVCICILCMYIYIYIYIYIVTVRRLGRRRWEPAKM